jgi:NitT/TauT family transport system ATP-binding protein
MRIEWMVEGAFVNVVGSISGASRSLGKTNGAANDLGLREARLTPAMRVDHLSKKYRGHQRSAVLALDDIDFHVGAAEFVSIVGPSGCGKSTLLKIMTGLLSATSGIVELNGTPVTKPREDIGVVFQSPVLFPWRTVLDNVLLPIDVLRRDRAANRPKARALLNLVGLNGFEDRYPWELSGGMQQRVAISRGLVHDPALLMMDEPFGALDAMTREHMNVELQRIWLESKKTVLFITHSIPEAVFLSDRVLVMTPRPGRILTERKIDLPRPRSLNVMNTPEFGEHVRTIRDHFRAVGGLD